MFDAMRTEMEAVASDIVLCGDCGESWLAQESMKEWVSFDDLLHRVLDGSAEATGMGYMQCWMEKEDAKMRDNAGL